MENCMHMNSRSYFKAKNTDYGHFALVIDPACPTCQFDLAGRSYKMAVLF